METPENMYQQASKTATMRATVTTAGVRRTNPRERKGRNQTAVPAKKKRKKTSDADRWGSCAARTPATRNGGQRLAPVRNPSARAPESSGRGASPICTRRLGCWAGVAAAAGAIRPRRPPKRRPAALGCRQRATSGRSRRAESTIPPTTPRWQIPDSRPGARQDTKTTGGCAIAFPAAEQASRATPPARRKQAYRTRGESEHERLSGAGRKR